MSYYSVPQNDNVDFVLFPLSVESNDSTDIILAPALPDQPIGLTFNSQSGTNITISWTDESASENGFRIYRSTTSGTTLSGYTEIDTVAANVTSYTDTSVQHGTRYFYRVVSFNIGGESDPTEEVTNDLSVLDSSEDLSVSNVTGTSADINWSDVNDVESGFNTYISEDDGNTWSIISSDLLPDSQADSISGLTNGKEYLVRVEVFNDEFEWNDAVDVSGTLEITDTRAVLYTTRIET